MNLETDRRQITPHCKDAWESGKDKMAYVKTKKEVLRYVQSKTHAQGQQTLTQTTAYEVSKELNISRALASQYLNELTKEGAVIKINSRPVYFLDRKTLEEAHGVSLSFNRCQIPAARAAHPDYWAKRHRQGFPCQPDL